MKIKKIEKLYNIIIDSFSFYPRDKSIMLHIERSIHAGYNKKDTVLYIYDLVNWLILLSMTEEKFDKKTKMAVCEMLEHEFYNKVLGGDT